MAKRKKKPAAKKKPLEKKTKTEEPKDKGGRPALYEEPAKLEAKIEEYFKFCITSGTKATIPGLALHLGFESKEAVAHLLTRKQGVCSDDKVGVRAYNIAREFVRVLKRARLTIEAQRNADLVSGRKGMSTRGIEFDLQVNFGHVPKTAVEQSGAVTVIEKVVEVK